MIKQDRQVHVRVDYSQVYVLGALRPRCEAESSTTVDSLNRLPQEVKAVLYLLLEEDSVNEGLSAPSVSLSLTTGTEKNCYGDGERAMSAITEIRGR